MHFSNLHTGLKEPLAPRADDDDDDDKEDDKADQAVKKNAAPLAARIQNKFIEQRKIFLWGPVTDESAKDLTEKLLFLEAEAPGKEITFYMNTPGGSITAGMAVYDTIRLITSPVKVIVTGMAASMGSILLQAPKQKGGRLVFPHARVMIHQPLIMGRIQAPAVDIHIQALEMERLRTELNEILAKASKQKLEKVIKDTDRDFYMTAEEAIEYGLADAIVTKL
jgi:ATP-dependent Clp protease protease subunit